MARGTGARMVDDRSQRVRESHGAQPGSSRVLRALREAGVAVGIALLLSLLLRTFLFQVFFVPSTSMYATLHVDDRIVASRITVEMQGIHRGDVVVFHDPGGWLPRPVEATGIPAYVRKGLEFAGVLPSPSGEDLVKRVIGVAGDHVMCCSKDGRIVVNGHELDESGYALGESTAVQFDITVPADRLFFMGDNREHSEDSRFHLDVASGTVSLSEVRGAVVLKVWPLSRFGPVPAPPALTDPALG